VLPTLVKLGIGFVAYSAFGKGYTSREGSTRTLRSTVLTFQGTAKNEDCSPERVGFELTVDFVADQ
jgi:aryl-alcohol dehydrogenase-like predicted oxidoreductase